MEKKLQTLKNILDSSRYTVALCGSGILKECGYPGILSLDVAYDIENRYGDSPEYIYSSAYFSTRPEKFFSFTSLRYQTKILNQAKRSTHLPNLKNRKNCRPLFLKIVFLFLKEPVVNMYIIFMGPFTKTYAHIVGKNILSNL